MKIRITDYMWKELCNELLKRNDVETAGILLGEPVKTSEGIIVVVREVKVIPSEAYSIRKIDQLSIDPIALNRLTKRARDKQWSIFTIHTHPGAKEAWFSKADDIGDSRLMPSFYCQVPSAPHGSIVLASSGDFIVRAFDEHAKSTEISLQIIGKTITNSKLKLAASQKWFSRQELALGEAGQLKLASLRVCVIGLGGIGSLVSMQLAHLGVGSLVLLDGDTVEASNVSRIVGAKKDDAGKTLKVNVAGDYAESLGLSGKVERYPHFLTSKDEELIAGCDVVMSCVDAHSARALLNRYSYKYHIPVIDFGTVFRVDSSNVILSDAGRVVVIGPDRPCLCCWGHIDANAIRIENLNADDLQCEINEGYIEGANVAQPSVISFNTYVAGAGVSEFLRLATGFAGIEAPPNRLAFSFQDGTVRRNSLAGNTNCSICGS
jgi:hypothetical protein